MGVLNFWQLIESTGRPVNMNHGLEGKVLAIDVSIWLHQAAKGMREKQNGHILLLVHRICKLLHFKIKPIFVFDGAVPELKRRVLAERKQRRNLAENKAEQSREKIRQNKLKMMALRQIRGEKIPEETFQSEEKDLFELEENHLQNQFDEIEQNDDKQNRNETFLLPEIEQIDDETVKDLPKQMQLDILKEIKEKLKRCQTKFEDLPKKGAQFSDYQLDKILKQSSVTKRILDLNKTIKRQKLEISDDPEVQVYGGELASDSSTQYVLVKSQTRPPEKIVRDEPIVVRRSMDFSAEQMMNRDPVAALQGKSTEQKNDFSQIETNSTDDSDSDDSDFVEVTTRPKLSEVEIIAPFLSVVEENFSLPTEIEPKEQQTSLNDESSESQLSEDKTSTSIELEQTGMSSTQPKDQMSSSRSDFGQSEKVPVESVHSDFSANQSSSVEQFTSTIIEPKPENFSLAKDLFDVEENSSSGEEFEEELQQAPMDFEQLESEINEENRAEIDKIGRNAATTATLTDAMHEDTKFLLRLFGIPFVVSPSEAEAQCAFLNLSGQCDGVITDDSDVFLFGARQVYRNFFRLNQLVEFFDADSIEEKLGLDRETMIAVGMIVGSDYTSGISSAGIVTAIEVLQEFQGNCVERLEKFRIWWQNQQQINEPISSKTLRHLKKLKLFQGFPNHLVYEAYVKPKVDENRGKFSWSMPQVDLIREFLGEKLKWNREKVDETILPVIKRLNNKQIQSRIDSFFVPLPVEGSSAQIRRNQRILSALELLKQRQKQWKERTPSDDKQQKS